MKNGFLRLPRRLFDETAWKQKRTFSDAEAIIDIYQSADKDGKLSVTIRSLADRWYWEQTRAFRLLQRMGRDGYITLQKSSSGTTITIIDFGQTKKANATPDATLNATPDATLESPSTKDLNDVDATPNATPNTTQYATSRAYKNELLYNHSIEEDRKNVILADNIRKSENISDAEAVKNIQAFFNRTIEDNNSKIPKVRSIKDQRRSMLIARIREYGIDAVYEAITKAAKSDFLNGGGNRGFTADFTWIVRPNNFPKILEGNYDNHGKKDSMSIGIKLENNNPDKYKESW